MSTSDPEEIRADIERTRTELSRDVDALGEKVKPGNVARRQVDRVRSGVTSVKDRVMGTAHDTADSARDASHGVAERGALHSQGCDVVRLPLQVGAVHVEHRRGRGERPHRVTCVPVGAEQPGFLRGRGEKEERASQRGTRDGERFRHRQDERHTARVVDRPRIDDGLSLLVAASAQMVVVSHQHDRLFRERRLGTRQHREHVRGSDPADGARDASAHLPAERPRPKRPALRLGEQLVRSASLRQQLPPNAFRHPPPHL